MIGFKKLFNYENKNYNNKINLPTIKVWKNFLKRTTKRNIIDIEKLNVDNLIAEKVIPIVTTFNDQANITDDEEKIKIGQTDPKLSLVLRIIYTYFAPTQLKKKKDLFPKVA